MVVEVTQNKFVEEFLKENYRLLTHGIELLAAFTGLFFYKKYSSTFSKYFIWFLVCIAICDILGGYTWYVHSDKFLNFLIGTIIEKNYWWTTFYWGIGAVLFYGFYYYKVLKTNAFKSIIKWSTCMFLVFSIGYIFIHRSQFFNQFFSVISIAGASIIFLCSVFYFLETLQSDNILTFYKSLNFYISASIFIWWLIITPLTFYDIYFAYEVGNENRDWNFIFLKWQIYLFANIFMYSTFTFALIYCKPDPKNE